MYHALYLSNWEQAYFEVQILETLLAEWTSTCYDQSPMTRERDDSHHGDRVNDVDSEIVPILSIIGELL